MGNLRSLGALLPPCSAPSTDVQTIPPNREPSALPAGKPVTAPGWVPLVTTSATALTQRGGCTARVLAVPLPRAMTCAQF